MIDTMELATGVHERIAAASAVIAGDLRTAEQTLQRATLDVLAYVRSTIEVGVNCNLSPTITQPMVKPALDVLQGLSECQDTLTGTAHPAALRVARRFGLTTSEYGGGYPKNP